MPAWRKLWECAVAMGRSRGSRFGPERTDAAAPTGLQPRPASARLGNAAELETVQGGGLLEALSDRYLARYNPRKLWEWEYLAQAARDCGLLDGQREALGIAVGTEPLIFFFANHARGVTATDLYSVGSAWGDARTANAQAILGMSPFPYPPGRVKIRNADMRALPFPDEHFDFCWSCSSIEHVDNLEQIVGVYNEIARVLKPGGCALLTTEFSLTPPYPLPGVMALDAALFAQVVEAHPAFDLIGPAELGYNPLHLGNAPEPRRFAGQQRPNRTESLYCFPAGRMANMCGLSVIVPIGFTLIKRPGGRPAAWRTLGFAEPLTILTEALIALDRSMPAEAAEKLAGCLQASTPQFRMIAHRYHLDATLRMPARPDAVRAAEDAFLAALPEGELQDADNIQMLAFSLAEHGRHAEAAATYRKAAASPSTFTDHAIHLAMRHLVQAELSGAAQEGIEFLALTVTDMLEHGVAWQRIEPNLLAEGAGHPQLAAITSALAGARRGSLDQWGSDYGL